MLLIFDSKSITAIVTFAIVCRVLAASEEQPIFEDEEEFRENTNEVMRERNVEFPHGDTSRQQQIDEDWMDQYNAIFFEGKGPKNPEEMVDTLDRLYRSNHLTSNSTSVEPLGREVFDLLRVTFTLALSCSNKSFEIFDGMMEKYLTGYSKNILDHIQFHRAKLWQMCKQSFMKCLEIGRGLAETDKTELMSMVEHIWAALPQPTNEPWFVNDQNSIETGLINYTRDKLGKRAHKLKNIEGLFREKIKSICGSVNFIFVGKERMGEIIKNRLELKGEFSRDDLKWLTAIEVCEMTRKHSLYLQNKARRIFEKERHEARSNSCFGKLLCQGGCRKACDR